MFLCLGTSELFSTGSELRSGELYTFQLRAPMSQEASYAPLTKGCSAVYESRSLQALYTDA